MKLIKGKKQGRAQKRCLQQMHRQDQQLSEGFESNQTIIQQGPHLTTTAFCQRPTDFAPRAIIRTQLQRKLPEVVNLPVDICEEAPTVASLIPLKKNDQGSSSKTPWEFYEDNRQNFRLVYTKRDNESVFGKEEDFTGRQIPLIHLLRYQEHNYAPLRPHESAASSNREKLIFDSRFECANLLCAFQSLSCPQDYHLFMENDTNRFGYNLWFYFSIVGAKPGILYHFKVVNFRKPWSFYKLGLSPVVFSQAQHRKTGNGWSRIAQNISYGPSSVYDVSQGIQCKLYCLTFDLRFNYDDDFITISSGLPYSYSRLTRQLKELKFTAQKNGLEWTQRTIAYTLSNNQVPYIVVSKPNEEVTTSLPKQNKSKKKKQNASKIQEGKPIILIMARQHPGQTHSSFLMEEMLKNLANMTLQSKQLLQDYQFHIFPMVNVDGVIYGNFRCDLAGFDLNRAWKNPLKEVHPQVHAISEKVKQLVEEQKVAFCFDLHSHSKQFGIFSYCCKEDEVQARIFPFMLSKANEHFLFPFCTFGLSRDKLSTARAVIASIVKHQNVLTIQASSFAVKTQSTITVLQPVHFKLFAKSVFETLALYFEGKQARRVFQNEIKTRLAEFQAYEGQNEQISGSDSQIEIDPREHIQHLRKLLPENTLKKLQKKCSEVEIQKKIFCVYDNPNKQSQKSISIISEPTQIQRIQKNEGKETKRFYPKAETRKQEVLAILRTKDGLKERSMRKAVIQEQPIIRMPIDSFKVNLTRYKHSKTEHTEKQQDGLMSEEESKLLQFPKPTKNRSSLILGSAHRQAMKITQPKAEPTRFKPKSLEEDETFEKVGDRRNMRRMSKVQKILRLRKRANTLKNIHYQERVQSGGNLIQIKIGDPQVRVDQQIVLPLKHQPARLKLNKSSTTINRPNFSQKEKTVNKPISAAVINNSNAQTSLIGQLWRINYGRYSKELS